MDKSVFLKNDSNITAVCRSNVGKKYSQDSLVSPIKFLTLWQCPSSGFSRLTGPLFAWNTFLFNKQTKVNKEHYCGHEAEYLKYRRDGRLLTMDSL